jgi:hypothetical protein
MDKAVQWKHDRILDAPTDAQVADEFFVNYKA